MMICKIRGCEGTLGTTARRIQEYVVHVEEVRKEGI